MGEPVVNLNRRLILERAERIADGAGGYVEQWVRVGVLWAQIKSGKGARRSEDFLTVSRVPVEVIVRASEFGAASRPQPDQRFIEGGRVFLITSVAELGQRGQYLSCHAREEVSA